MGIWGRRIANRRESSNVLVAEVSPNGVRAEMVGAARPRANLLSIDLGKSDP
jgi:hypothetical protein